VGGAVRRKDLAEMSRRLEEEYDLLTCGYEPAYSDQREPWIKCHAGDLLSREEALRQIKEERESRRLAG
jgi:hypothetical protein